ncbi:MAG: DUF2158 domain-containing protein [Aestuariivita sp.]|nr:DUF2158 domain-containing protein [Aestuariivita sp.]
MNEFKTGEFVQLKSGGPKMTVEQTPDKIFSDNFYIYTWFSGAKHSRAKFSEETLQKYVEDNE